MKRLSILAACGSILAAQAVRAQWSVSGTSVYYAGGNVGIGTAAPGQRLHVASSGAANGTSAVFGVASSATGVTNGVFGQSASNVGRGILGWASGTTGANIGVMGQTSSKQGRGVFGWANTAFGVNYGVEGRSSSANGTGVLGLATATSGLTYGVFGETRTTTFAAVPTVSNTPAGVFGRSTNTAGTAVGILGHSVSPTGAGVAGASTAFSGENAGVYGECSSPVGSAISGHHLGTTGESIGVYGTTNSFSAGWAAYGDGDIGASGQKLFHIDHPLDPANTYLNHFCAEGPEPLLMYRGNATLDALGAAWVDLPDYFEALNTEYHYQLTPIGAPALLYVSSEIESNRFQIAGGQPGMKVSWMVTGRRNDPYVRAYAKPVEQPKSAEERGKFLHPELYGQPANAAVHKRLGVK